MKKLFTFLAAFFITVTTFAQIPNAGFETWQTKTGIGFSGPYSYQQPQSWELGFISELFSSFGMKPNIDRSNTSQTGSWALKLSSNADTLGSDIVASFKLNPNTRPAALTGSFATSGVVTNPNNYAQAFVFMTKWTGTKRDTIGFGATDLDNAPNGFKPFNAQVQYSSPATPDSAIIYFLYFPESANTHILIDDLAMTNLLATPKEINNLSQLNLFPNPVNDQATLTFQAQKTGPGKLLIRDLTGKEVKAEQLNNLKAGANSVTIKAEDLKPGTYLATLQTENGTQTLRFIKR